MKKILSMAIATVMLLCVAMFSLAGCGNIELKDVVGTYKFDSLVVKSGEETKTVKNGEQLDGVTLDDNYSFAVIYEDGSCELDGKGDTWEQVEGYGKIKFKTANVEARCDGKHIVIERVADGVTTETVLVKAGEANKENSDGTIIDETTWEESIDIDFTTLENYKVTAIINESYSYGGQEYSQKRQTIFTLADSIYFYDMNYMQGEQWINEEKAYFKKGETGFDAYISSDISPDLYYTTFYGFDAMEVQGVLGDQEAVFDFASIGKDYFEQATYDAVNNVYTLHFDSIVIPSLARVDTEYPEYSYDGTALNVDYTIAFENKTMKTVKITCTLYGSLNYDMVFEFGGAQLTLPTNVVEMPSQGAID